MASASTAGKTAVSVVPVPEVIVFRFALAALALWAVVLIQGGPLRLRQLARRSFPIGLIEPGLITSIIYFGLFLTTAVHATVFYALMPLITSLLGRVFLKEAIAWPVIVGSVIAFGGTLLLISAATSHGQASLAGDLMVAGGIVLACIVQLSLRRTAQAHGQPAVISAFLVTGGFVSGMVILAVAAALGSRAGSFAWPSVVGADIWVLLFYLAFVSASGFFLYAYALRHIPIGRLSLYFVMVTPLGVPIAATVLGESVNGRELTAIFMVIAGVALPPLVGVTRSLSGRIRRAAGTP